MPLLPAHSAALCLVRVTDLVALEEFARLGA
jgi:hypothetical protein